MRKLQTREKLFLTAGAAVVAAFVGWTTFDTAVLERIERLDRRIAARRAELKEMTRLLERHSALRARLSALELKVDRLGDETFFSRLNKILSESRLQNHLDAAQPQQNTEVEGFIKSSVELKLSRLTYGATVELLRRLALGDTLVSIERLSLERRFENPDELDVALSLASYQRKR
jgi:Tfp pilus assembly protein PilN